MQIDSSQIHLLIFRSQIDSYSYSPQFQIMKIILICEYSIIWRVLFLFTNIFLRFHEYFIIVLNIYIDSIPYISLWLCLPGKFFKWKKYKSCKTEIITKTLRKNIFQVFVNNLQILPIWQIVFLILFISFGIHKLFLFVQKLALRICSYSNLREN